MSIGSAILRGVTGAWILNSGIGKISADTEHATALRDMAATGIPQFADLTPQQFKKLIIAAELGVGAALLAPFVPTRVAGAALSGFAAGLLTMYFRNSSLTQSDGVRWTPEGTPLAKDLWLAAIGANLVISGK